MSSSSSPCAACKFLRRKCTQECVFAPYFPPDKPQKFKNVHNMFGASNVAKLLNELSALQREDAVNSLVFEAEARLKDPIYGCVGFISILQQRLKLLEIDLASVRKELVTYIGPQAMLPLLQPPPPTTYVHHQEYQFHVPVVNNSPYAMPFNGNHPMVAHQGGGQMVVQDQPTNQMLEMKQMMELKEQQQCHVFRNGQINGNVSPMGSSLGLGIFDATSYQVEQQPDHHHHPMHNQLQQPQLMGQSIPTMTEHHQQPTTQPQQLQQFVRSSGSEEASNVYKSRATSVFFVFYKGE